jgi:sugar lactone lactonase YvrE
MMQSQPPRAESARRTRFPVPIRGSRARLVAALVLPGAFVLTPRSAQANAFLDLTWLAALGKNGATFESPLSVAIDPVRGEVAVANTGRGRIEILTPAGRPSASFEHRVRRPDGSFVLGQPRLVRYDAAGHLLVGDNLDSGIDVLDFRGRVIGRFDIPAAQAMGADTAAGALLLLKDGSILIAANGEAGRIHHFSATGQWLGAWGAAGSGKGQLSRISALAQTPAGDILVACGGTELAIQRFDSRGVYIAGFGQHEIGPGNFSYPSGMAVTPDGRIWVSDELRLSVSVFDADGLFLGMAGEGGPDPGSFFYPSDVTTDGKGRLAVVERIGARVQMFKIRDADPSLRALEGR